MSRMSRVGLAALAAVAALSGGATGAQQVFRIVGPDGRITFADKPPVDSQGRASAAPTVAMPSGGSSSSSVALPFELRSVTNRYPVTLYTGQDCGPCVAARGFLTTRGIPFSERTVSSEEDIEALKRLAGAARLPFLTIGSQQLKGYAESEWNQYLDAAGYPKSSQLPSSYRQPSPAPMVAVQQPPARQTPQQRAAEQQPSQSDSPQSLEPPPPNPSGIRF